MRQLKITPNITNRESIAVEKYLADISTFPMLTPEQETAIAQRKNAVADNSKEYQDAIDTLVNGNLRFVVSVAKQYLHQWLSLPDVINEWNIGLITAAKRFDETRWFKFISYAVRWIRQAILKAIIEQWRIVRLPFNKVWNIRKMNKVIQSFEQQREREPSVEEISEVLDVEVHEVEALVIMQSKHASLDKPLWDENDAMTMWDYLEATQKEIYASFNNEDELNQSVRVALEHAKISSRDRELLYAYYGIDWKNIEHFREQYDLSKERVRQLKENLQKKLKNPHGIFAKIIHSNLKPLDWIKNATWWTRAEKKADNSNNNWTHKKVKEVSSIQKNIIADLGNNFNISLEKNNWFTVNNDTQNPLATTVIWEQIPIINYDEIWDRITTLLQKWFWRQEHLKNLQIDSVRKKYIEIAMQNFTKYGKNNRILTLEPKEIIQLSMRNRELDLLIWEKQYAIIIEEFLDSIPILEGL